MDAGMIWRATLDRHHAALARDLADQFESELAEARDAVRRQTAETLNQTLRRLRQCPAEQQTLQMIIEASVAWAHRAALLLVQDDEFRIAGSRGMEGLREFTAVVGAPAIAACVENGDPMTVLCTAGQVGHVLAEVTGEGSKAWLFPIVVRKKTAAVLIAAGEVSPGPLEVLAEAAGMRLESQRAQVVTLAPTASFSSGSLPSGIVQIQDLSVAGPRREPTAWADLTADDQSRHLLAQRVARVRVAEMRLEDNGRLEKAVFAGNIYTAFRESIDRARDEFLHYHLEKSATMVDYLHLEILRSLAHDDELLLGADYPGPMA